MARSDTRGSARLLSYGTGDQCGTEDLCGRMEIRGAADVMGVDRGKDGWL